jgi:hypothetical protein
MHYLGQYAPGSRVKWQQGLQQLGQDLQAGNLSAAQSDFAALQQLNPQISSTASAQGGSVAQEIAQLGKDLRAGNTSAAQQDYSQLQQQISPTASGVHHHHHHHGGSGGSGFSQLLQQLGQALQAGNLSAAQQAYATLQQQVQALEPNRTAQPAQSGVAVNA